KSGASNLHGAGASNLTDNKHGTDGSHIAISFNYYNNRRFSMILHAPSGLSEGSGNFQTVCSIVNYFILTTKSNTTDIHAS
ncbi:hypothetical protein, partial [Pilosibacter fragilis]|uniref:hypothetical protein n=1 Tax=Pilosibacter fragilis TaxID=3078042 RepID=UPI003F563B4D